MTAEDRAALVVGSVAFVLAAAPTVILLWIASTGAVGTTPRFGLVLSMTAVVAAVTAVAVAAIRRARTAVQQEPGRFAVDCWVAAYVAGVVWLLGAVGIPILILALSVNSDRALVETGFWLFLIWLGAHLLWAAVSLGAARLVFGPTLRPARSQPGIAGRSKP